MSTVALLQEALANVTELAQRQLELVRQEAAGQLQRERNTAVGIALAGALALIGVVFLLFAACLAVAGALAIPIWAASLAVAGLVLLFGSLSAGIGWRGRARRLLPVSRDVLEKEIEWTRQKMSS
jgi:membrane protein implicated in regulation of membrane protease activity